MKFVKREKIEKNKKNKKNRSKCFGKGSSADIFPKQNGGFVHIFFFFFICILYFVEEISIICTIISPVSGRNLLPENNNFRGKECFQSLRRKHKNIIR